LLKSLFSGWPAENVTYRIRIALGTFLGKYNQDVLMLQAFGLTDPGCVRPNNEDYFISDSACSIFILADGMGGAAGGEFASRLSAEKLYEYLLEPGHGSADCLEQGFHEAHHLVRQAAADQPELDGMATTLVMARALPATSQNELAEQPESLVTFQIGSVGDSRAYYHSPGHLQLVTVDQTWVAEVGSRLGLSEEVLKKHHLRHVLTMAVGIKEDLRIFTTLVELAPGDQILLCSDGLHGVLSEKILLDTLDSEKTLEQKCHSLVEAAKDAGGPDNVTVLLIQVP
jgi:protein phosphatase